MLIIQQRVECEPVYAILHFGEILVVFIGGYLLPLRSMAMI